MRILGLTFVFALLYMGTVYSQQAGVGRSIYVPSAKSQQRNPPSNSSTVRTPFRNEGTFSDTARLEWVRHLSSNSASGVDIATDVVIDNRGSVYVTGKSESAENGRNYLTIKYDTHGLELWRAQYDGPAHGDDVPSALAIDAAGNVYVTGMSMGIVPGQESWYNSYDYATIKYNSAGQEQWVARYANFPGGTDAAAAIAVDATGNVYVTGESGHDSTLSWWHYNADFATIKYNSDGVQQWVARYDDIRSGIADMARALALDDSGNVFVTGVSEGNNYEFHSKVVTLKYNPSGMQQWVAGVGLDSMNTEPTSVVVDNSGDVYVAGETSGPAGSSILAAKFNSLGQEQWVRTCLDSLGASYHASSLSIDHAGDIVIGAIEGSYYRHDYGISFVTMKFSTTGDLSWVQRYSAPNPWVLKGKSTVDNDNNVYATFSIGYHSSGFYHSPPYMGDTIVTVKYDANGGMQWIQRYTGAVHSYNVASAIAVNHAGTIVVAGGSGPTNGSDFVAIKYQPSGTKEWDARANEEGYSFESLSAMTLDAAGNVYVTGSSLDPNSSHDYFTAKFNAAGSQLWLARYDGPANGADYSNAIALDGAGNIYVTGSSKGVGTLQDWATIKYNSLGVEQWVARYNGVTNQNDEATLITVDSVLNVYVAGSTASGARMTTIKYSSLGQQQWATSYDSVNSEKPSELRVDKNGNVYVTKSTLYWVADAIAFKYNSLGVEAWRVLGGDDILVDDSANVYITSSYSETRKYNSGGALIWQATTGGTRMEFDNAGDILLLNPYNAIISKITKWGVLRWSHWFSQIGAAFGFCVDATGNGYVSGNTWDHSTYTAKVSPKNSVRWLTKYLSENSVLIPQACQVDASGNLYVAGINRRDDFSNVMTILKYGQVTVSVNEEAPALPESYSLSQNYPNPFNPSTTIQFALPKSGSVELKIYNTLGQEVATLVNEEKVVGTYSVQWNASNVASGVYFYQLQAGGYRETKKLLLMK